jgi:phosphoribosyl 1,2-cyclic phosphodiesterase
MIEFKSLASSSSGNSYIVNDGKTELLLEAGIRWREIQKALDFKTQNIQGCLITHEHGDHIKSASEVMKACIPVYASQGTLEAANLTGHRAFAVQSGQQFTIGSWTIMPFKVEHDVSEPLGFLLANDVGEKMVFITDSYYCRYTFPPLNLIAVECNYSKRLLDENIANKVVPAVMKKRLVKSHFCLENVLEFLKANDLTKVEEIHLLHLSDNNSDEAMFKKAVQEQTGKLVYIAER